MSTHQTILITGGAGFIGSAVVRQYIEQTDATIVNVDKLTYAGNLESLGPALEHPRHVFEQADIADRQAIDNIFHTYQPDAVLHLAAESHVDRSIDGPAQFIHTNIMGSYNLLESARVYWNELDTKRQEQFRFLHISTDEVYGSLGIEGQFNEHSPYMPNSPYAASKASSDHLVRAWHHTYGLPVLITNCSNNYGPYQFPEKLIPLIILNALEGEPLPVYGRGEHVRDWLYVEDHARALRLVLEKGRLGETYNIGGHCERKNIEVVRAICDILDELWSSGEIQSDCNNGKLSPTNDYGSSNTSYQSLITFVSDRPGHDQRYAIDASKIERELGWAPKETFETGLRKTIKWYLENREWCRRVQDGSYQRERLGLKNTF